MSQSKLAQTFLTVSDLSKQSQEILRQLLERLEHLDLTGKLSAEDQIIQTAHGGNGDVYAAYIWIGGKKFKVALKRLRFYIYKDKGLAKLIAKEIKIWSCLCHPNVLELLGYVLEENGFPSLISRWMGNGTALEYVRAHPEADILPLVLGIAKGLEYLHQQDVVHSDIKSDNVLISEAEVPLICDFGTSRMLTATQTLGTETTSEKLKGTLRWLAMEFFSEGLSTHTKESDVWAFGMTAYELLVKDRPYYHIRLEPQVLFAIVKGEKPLQPEGLESASKQTIWRICELCWSNGVERLSMSDVVTSLSQTATIAETRTLLHRQPQSVSTPFILPAVPAESAASTGAIAQQASVDFAAATTNDVAAGNRSLKPRSPNRVVGDYTLGKTIGQGSMGKVKLAYHNVTSEKFAIKIIPRAGSASTQAPIDRQDWSTEAAAEQASKDALKGTRAIREAALSMLLHHPHVCGMRELITHRNHYFMVFEYINGGQMLDYIISHGRLREREARKFSRQIGSALDYCHRNNVVHRSLKIEDILITQTGDIKIIDFGLSNLYNPMTHLSTFCGSLYFAAPELLNAQVYTGPEVDVWSFGVVLYILVCGKVPFDDQSMPALHAKIKRGLVEYPNWLSAEFKHLLTRMLVVNPAARATLVEVLSHPWMIRGYEGPPDTHLLQRKPLRAGELDRQVIKGMHGFGFGSEDEIEQKLTEVLKGEAYVRSVENWERKNNAGESSSTPSVKSQLLSTLGFYRRKLRSPSTTQKPASVSNLLPEPSDPTSGFHPLISVYFLAREKLQREFVDGLGQFTDSETSVSGPSESHSSA